jgi:hypothetical protein
MTKYFAVVSCGPYYPRFVLTFGRYSGRPDHDQLGSPWGQVRHWESREAALADARAYADAAGFIEASVYRMGE